VKKPAESGKTNLVPRILPRGRHKLDPELVAASQRQRLLEAIVQLVAEKGYADVTIGEIVSRAGTAKRTFYDHFSDKPQCFLAALDGISDALVASSTRLFSSASGSVRERCEYAIRGYLELLVSMPSAAKVFYLEAVAAGPEVVTRNHDVLLRFARGIVALSKGAAAAGEGWELTEMHALGVVGAIHHIIHGQILRHGPDSVIEVIDGVVQMAVGFLTVRIPSERSTTSRRRRAAR